MRPRVAFNPLATIAAVVPAVVVLILARDLATPISFLALGALALAVTARLGRRAVLALTVALPLFVVVSGATFAVWTDPARAAPGAELLRLGDYALTTGMLGSGFATALRLAALLVLALLLAATSSGADLVRASVQYLRVPYRIGYTALASFRFVPRSAHELELIRQAHRVRGMAGGRGPVAGIRRWAGYVVPLLAGAIRHAERVALAMDARAFGAHPTRTERHSVPFRARDAAIVVLFWTATVVVVLARRS
ncbi:energy-coupling factor transporter transmembrane component T family protein [Salinibacterium soli]|uniref:Energy-coupling factor transporter transmembrane component T n=1 Tax=Antiquaquibacter soli TaxID=3064523 RepID=A0ABT9BRB4_9MICO|nr:energy-coupling factor transporter transmembrane component T [Protaetiibacter sp. WY-16]MDO7883558.1 energy-coupling factor transporter transmembrane component T [Protaetiibacter sp. WY-16]